MPTDCGLFLDGGDVRNDRYGRRSSGLGLRGCFGNLYGSDLVEGLKLPGFLEQPEPDWQRTHFIYGGRWPARPVSRRTRCTARASTRPS